jgi:hypothetical protein
VPSASFGGVVWCRACLLLPLRRGIRAVCLLRRGCLVPRVFASPVTAWNSCRLPPSAALSGAARVCFSRYGVEFVPSASFGGVVWCRACLLLPCAISRRACSLPRVWSRAARVLGAARAEWRSAPCYRVPTLCRAPSPPCMSCGSAACNRCLYFCRASPRPCVADPAVRSRGVGVCFRRLWSRADVSAIAVCGSRAGRVSIRGAARCRVFRWRGAVASVAADRVSLRSRPVLGGGRAAGFWAAGSGRRTGGRVRRRVVPICGSRVRGPRR